MSGFAGQELIEAHVKSFREERMRVSDFPSVVEKLPRLHYVLDRMVARVAEDSVAMTHARTPASVMLGLKNGDLRSRVRSVSRRGSVEASLEWLEEWMPAEVWPVPEFQRDWLGTVYVAAAVEFPGVFKVGFTQNLSERLKALKYAARTPIALVLSFPGTMLDEHLLQHDMRSRSLANEWFDFDGRYFGSDRLMRFYTPDRMWAVLHANFGNVNTARKFKFEAA